MNYYERHVGDYLRDAQHLSLLDPPVDKKHLQQWKEKQRIAEAAAKLVREGECILLDSGTTTTAVAHALRRFDKLTVVTNGVNIAADLAGTVSILGRTQKEGDEPVGRFTFKGISLGPYESKEGVAPVDTKLRVYELPDWQMTVAQLQLTSP